MPGNSKLLGLLSACVLAYGQTGAAPADDKSASVQGVVTNSITGEPILRAHVVFRPMFSGPGPTQKKFGALTTVEGKFSIAGLDPGRYSIGLDKIGFVTPPNMETVVLQAGEKKADLKLKLVPTGSITGRVVNADGEPVENALVAAENAANPAGPNGRTDEKGQFRIGGLLPGRYRVRATPQDETLPPEIRTDGTKEAHYAPTYYPSVLLAKSAAFAEARAGTDTGGIDIRLIRTPIVRVSGMVSGLPPGTQGVRVQVQQGRSAHDGGMVKADGTFEIWKMNPGKYTLYAVWTQPALVRMQSSPVEIEVADTNIDHLALNMIPPMDLNGSVAFEDEKARPQQPPPPPPQQRSGSQQVQTRPVSRRINFIPTDSFMSPMAELFPDDSFKVTGLAPSRYHVVLTWGGAYVKSMRLGSTQIDGDILDLRNGAAGDSLTLVASSAMGSITGTVSDDTGPAAAAMVALAPESFDPMLPNRYMTTKPDGTYQIGGLPPGRYKIVAVDEANRALVMQRGALDELVDGVESIEIRANDTLTKDLKIHKQ